MNLSESFDLPTQIEFHATNYVNLGFHTHLGEARHSFINRFRSIMEKAGELAVPNTDLAIIPVVPEKLISLEDQLRLSRNRAFLKSSEMHQLSAWEFEPEEPYGLVGVSLGDELKHLSADDARVELGVRERTGLRLIELLSLGIFVPDEFTVDGIRGRYAVETHHVLDGEATVVDFYRYGDSLKVKRDPGTINDPQWTTPSYEERIVVA